MSQSVEDTPSVVLVSQFFYPDTSANSTVLSELVVGLANRNKDVSVLTTQPSYTEADRESSHPKHERYKGVDVRRIPATRFDRNTGLLKRILNELSFFLSAFVYLIIRHRGDVLLLPTAPTFLPIAGWLVRFRGYRPVPIVMDLYPAMAVELGYLNSNSPIRSVWDWLNRQTYRTAPVTVTIGETMADRLRKEYGPCRVEVIHNWEDGDFIRPKDKSENPFAREHGFDKQFTLIYSGNLGRHHDLKSLVEAATILETEGAPPFELVFIGEGGKKEKLQRLAESQATDSVTFLPYQPVEVLPDSLTSGDVSIVTMARGVEGLCVSSKFYTALSSGQAILAITPEDAEIANVVNRNGCGIHVEPDSPEKVASAIRGWLENPEVAEEMGRTARDVFEAEFTRDTAIDAYSRLVDEIV